MTVGSNVNPNFPIPGVDQSSRGFRDNFATIKTEIENLQSKNIQLVGSVVSDPVQIGNGSGDIIIPVEINIPGQIIENITTGSTPVILSPPFASTYLITTGGTKGVESIVLPAYETYNDSQNGQIITFSVVTYTNYYDLPTLSYGGSFSGTAVFENFYVDFGQSFSGIFQVRNDGINWFSVGWNSFTADPIGSASTAEGAYTVACGVATHAEGIQTTASGFATHAEGVCTVATVVATHAEGRSSTASGFISHAEGCSSTASGFATHAEGVCTDSSGFSSHAEGIQTDSSGFGSHAEGFLTVASGCAAHAEGFRSTASACSSHAEGYRTTASGFISHAEGCSSTASGNSSHAEGIQTDSSGYGSHAEGIHTIASGNSSHAEGTQTTASGCSSHAGGRNTLADSYVSSTAGIGSWARGIPTIQSYSSGCFSTVGDNQTSQVMLRATTTDSTPTLLSIQNAGPTQQFTLVDNETTWAEVVILGKTAGAGDFLLQRYEVMIQRGAGASSTVIPTTTPPTPVLISNYATAGAITGAWSVAFSADTTYGALSITVTGPSSDTVNWTCLIQDLELVL